MSTSAPGSALLNQAARLVRVARDGTPADTVLREHQAQAGHRASWAERRTLARAVFVYFRWWRWLEPRDSLQKQIAAALALQERFDTQPKSFKPQALAVRAVPEWLHKEMDAVPAEWLAQLQRDPVLWLRARSAHVSAVMTQLGAGTNSAAPSLAGPSALRYEGNRDLFQTEAFKSGLFEIQDLASQLVGHACAPRAGETWWDACAGEGGKTLHLADLMENRGLIWASDRSARRLTQLKKRAARADCFNYRAAPWEGGEHLPTKTRFDGVLVDAPCSGIGTWQRNPHARWTTTPDDVRELAAVQLRLLTHSARAVKVGGRLVYSVCTLTRAETTDIVAAFATAHPEFTPAKLALPGEPTAQLIWPHEFNANGMFLAAWQRQS